ncbi:MAG: M20/M25/M40 family metallo-hydrolase [Bryobacteraceae bacterium]
MKALRFLVFAAAFTALAADITPDHYLAYVKYLASPELKGRRTGTPEANQAADFLASEFRKANVERVNGSYFQNYDVTVKTALGPDDSTVLHLGTTERKLRENTEFVPLTLSSNGTVSAPVVFAGYGITAPEYHYDDYTGLDAKGKVVLVLRHEPQENDPKSVFNGKELTVHAEFESKIVNAKQHGARAILIVNDAPNHGGGKGDLHKFEPVTGLGEYGILAEQITAPAGDQLLASAGQSLASVIRAIDQNLKPHSMPLPPGDTADIRVDIQQDRRTTRNVIGYVAGQTSEYVIFGAHYDHLGLGGQDSLAPSQVGHIHPGADDNASGTAGVLELARHFASGPKHKRGFLFLCFSGEEEGLLGSEYYTDHPLLPLREAAAMINMDMIGRVRNDKVYIGGSGTAKSFAPLIKKASAEAGIHDDESEAGGYDGSSDHASFTAKQIPTLFFFSGLHSDYHKPSDTWDKINASDAVRLLYEIANIATTLADEPTRPQFIRASAPPHGGAGPSGGYGPYFGSIPDFGSSEHGVRFSDLRDGSPAAKAGLKAGDVLVEFDGKAIQNLYDFTYALRAHKPGDVVVVKVMRGGKPIEARVTLAKRE